MYQYIILLRRKRTKFRLKTKPRDQIAGQKQVSCIPLSAYEKE